MGVNGCFDPLRGSLLRSIELQHMLILPLGNMLVSRKGDGREGYQDLKGGAQLVESRSARSGLGCDIHFELLLRGESGGGFYFLIQDDKGEKVTGETVWTVAQA